MGSEVYQVGVIAVKVDLNQVAALAVEDSYGKQSAVDRVFQALLLAADQRPGRPGNEGAALGSARAVHG